MQEQAEQAQQWQRVIMEQAEQAQQPRIKTGGGAWRAFVHVKGQGGNKLPDSKVRSSRSNGC